MTTGSPIGHLFGLMSPSELKSANGRDGGGLGHRGDHEEHKSIGHAHPNVHCACLFMVSR
jgi:hypothetical protein